MSQWCLLYLDITLFLSNLVIAVKMSDSLSFETAAAGIGDGVKCYTALHYLGHLQRGETVLITDPLSSWGTLLLQLCKHLGTKTFAFIHQAGDKSAVTALGAGVY